MGALGLPFLNATKNSVLANKTLKTPGGGEEEGTAGKTGSPSRGRSLAVSWRLPGMDTELFLEAGGALRRMEGGPTGQ